MKIFVRILAVVFLMLAYQRAIAADDQMAEGLSKVFLHKYFGSDNYLVLNEKLDLKGVKLFFAVRYVNAKKKIFDRGLGFSIVNGNVMPRVYFEENKVLDGNRKSVFDATVTHYHYYGWAFEWPKTAPKVLDYFYLSYWRDGGKYTADSIEFDWNGKWEKFEMRNYEDEK